MIAVKNAEGVPYDAPGHVGVFGIRKIAADQAKHFIVNYSYFLPNGGCTMGPAPWERVYYLMSGNMTINGKNEKHELGPGDLIYIAPGEDRDVVVTGGKVAEVLVIMATKE
jgi:glyoxylate utilization-related uncharacterized protein